MLCIIHTKANMLHVHSDYQTQMTRSLRPMSHFVPRRYPEPFPPKDEVNKSLMYLLALKASFLRTPHHRDLPNYLRTLLIHSSISFFLVHPYSCLLNGEKTTLAFCKRREGGEASKSFMPAHRQRRSKIQTNCQFPDRP